MRIQYFAIVFVVTLFSLCLVHPISAQDTLTVERNLVRAYDILEKQRVNLNDEGEAGNNVVWDFSNVTVDNSLSIARFYGTNDSDSVMLVEADHAYSFVMRNDTMITDMVESRLARIDFTDSPILLKYPFAYEDSLYDSFSGKGLYCDGHLLSVSGDIRVKADGSGLLRLCNGFSFKDVLRVRTESNAAICMDVDSLALSPAGERKETVVCYSWYAKGYRYPLLELIERTSFDGSAAVASYKEAYMTLPDNMYVDNDVTNEALRRNGGVDDERSASETDADGILCFYDVAVNGNEIKINYSLSDIADVSFLVCDFAGIVYKSIKQYGNDAGSHAVSIDCGNLRPGEYIVYINAGGTTVNEKINLNR